MSNEKRQRHPDRQGNAAEPAAPAPPRVCLLTETYAPIVGGGETQARLLAEGLADRGSPALVVTRRVRRQDPRQESLAGVEIHRLPPAGRRRPSKWGLSLTVLPALLRMRHRYDLILVSGFRILGPAAVLAARWSGKRVVLKADSLGEMSGDYFAAGLAGLGMSTSTPPFRWLLAWRNRLLRQAGAFVAISAAVRDELLEHGMPPERIHAIPNSVDTARFRPPPPGERGALRRRLGIPFDDLVVTYTGRLVSYKGLPLLLRVWQELHQDHPRAGLLLVGSGGLDVHDCEEELRRFVDLHALGPSVHFAGSVANVEEFLQASDLFVFPTEQEAFGISLIEAMACGLPVVTAAVGGTREIVEDGVDGLAVDPHDGRQLSAALGRLLGDEALRRRLGEAGRRSAERRYSTAAVIRSYVGLFAGLATEMPRR